MIADAIALLAGLFFFLASLGLFRMPDAYCRIHAATKASSMGIILLCLASLIAFKSTSAILFSVLIVGTVFLTAPLACHAITMKLRNSDKAGTRPSPTSDERRSLNRTDFPQYRCLKT